MDIRIEVDDRQLRRNLKRMRKEIKSRHIDGARVGFIDGARYLDGESVATVAVANEFGTRRIPAASVLPHRHARPLR